MNYPLDEKDITDLAGKYFPPELAKIISSYVPLLLDLPLLNELLLNTPFPHRSRDDRSAQMCVVKLIERSTQAQISRMYRDRGISLTDMITENPQEGKCASRDYKCNLPEACGSPGHALSQFLREFPLTSDEVTYIIVDKKIPTTVHASGTASFGYYCNRASFFQIYKHIQDLQFEFPTSVYPVGDRSSTDRPFHIERHKIDFDPQTRELRVELSEAPERALGQDHLIKAKLHNF